MPRYSKLPIILCAVALLANAQQPTPTLRTVRDNTILSPELPKADLKFGKDFHYVGGQQVNLYGMAEAEQHLFAKTADNHAIEAFYWIQFEHRVAGDQHTYDYQLGHTTDIGGLNFVYDVKSWPDYASEMNDDPKSDGAAISQLASTHGFRFPQHAVRVRMFHLPTPDRRTELMIIYGEALPENAQVPLRKEGVDLMQEAPAFAEKLLANLKSQLTIKKK